MAAWTTIPDSDVDPESPITTSLMQALRDNPTALAEGAAGHPEIVQAAIAAAAVGQTQLKTDSGTVSGVGNVTLPGGAYGFYPQTKASPASNATFQIASVITNNSYVTNINLTINGQAQQRFVDSSPPYDLGNGNILLFIFVIMNNDGTVKAIYVSTAPPWANNGPTDIRPHFVENGIKKQRKLMLPSIDDPYYLDALRKPVYGEIEVTQALKQADMPMIPHPFTGNDLTGKTIVLLEPTGDICEQLYLLHENGGDVSELIHDGYLKIGNDPVDVNAPPGVIPVSLKWKNTR